jgi:hypothetical protein
VLVKFDVGQGAGKQLETTLSHNTFNMRYTFRCNSAGESSERCRQDKCERECERGEQLVSAGTGLGGSAARLRAIPKTAL